MYTKQSIDNKVKKMLAEQACIDISSVKSESTLKDDLSLDSLDIAEVSISLDSEYLIDFSREELMMLKTVEDLVEHVDHILNPIGI